MLNILKSIARAWHEKIYRAPQFILVTYISLISIISRHCVSRTLSNRIMNSVTGAGQFQSDIPFRPRSVRVGLHTQIMLTPHIGEFDQEALSNNRILSYESPVFEFLEREATHNYDLVIEIGANVGVYSVSFDALIKKQHNARLKRVFAFEPAMEPFRRLLENINANRAKRTLQHIAQL